MLWIGCDTGGTFTDFVMFDSEHPESGLQQLKLSSTPDNPARAVLEGVAQLAAGRPVREVSHATTVATNALLEGTGGRVALLTTRGFGDVPWLGRGERAQLYSLRPSRTQPPLSRGDVRELSQRHDARGQRLTPLMDEEVETVLHSLPEVDAVAICLLHSPLNPEHELRLLQACEANSLTAFASHQLSPTVGEYERGMTCLLAAYLAPKVRRYISELAQELSAQDLWIVHSAGGRLRPDEAQSMPHRLALSGPAAGLRGALALARQSGQPARLITLDMGGTSTDVALCDEELPYLWESEIGGLPLRAPSLEIHTIGAGGGSLARTDEGGFLRVGPRSAGATPGPACYGRGGTQPTITDALCWSNCLPPTLGDEAFPLDREASREALEQLGRALQLDCDQTALGILELSVAHLGRAVRKVSTGRGQDPAQFTLFPFGGAGPLLACSVAESLGMGSILVPGWAGVLSAWGALSAPWEREWSQPVPLDQRLNQARVAELLQTLKDSSLAELSQQPEQVNLLVTRRYQGQGEGLTGPPEQDFHQFHQARYGFARPNCLVETIEVRVRVRQPQPSLESGHRGEGLQLLEQRQVLTDEGWRDVPVFTGQLGPEENQAGPFLFLGGSSTLLVKAGWRARGLNQGNLLLEYQP